MPWLFEVRLADRLRWFAEVSRLVRGDAKGVVLVMIDKGGPAVDRFLHRLDKEPKRVAKP